MTVIGGACPLLFHEPDGGIHPNPPYLADQEVEELEAHTAGSRANAQ